MPRSFKLATDVRCAIKEFCCNVSGRCALEIKMQLLRDNFRLLKLRMRESRKRCRFDDNVSLIEVGLPDLRT